MLEIKTFGGLRIREMGKPMGSMGLHKAEAILVYLAVEGKQVNRLYIEQEEGSTVSGIAASPGVIEGTAKVVLSVETEEDLLTIHAEALEYIVAHTLDGLNARQRQDEVADSLELPHHLAEHPTLNEQYVSPADISRMVMKQYCMTIAPAWKIKFAAIKFQTSVSA